jgi:hypothetical protein
MESNKKIIVTNTFIQVYKWYKTIKSKIHSLLLTKII